MCSSEFWIHLYFFLLGRECDTLAVCLRTHLVEPKLKVSLTDTTERLRGFVREIPLHLKTTSRSVRCFTLYPCSTKTREVLGNPSPTAERFPETREISRGRSPREISRVEGNLEGRGDGFPNISRVLVEHGQSLSINFLTGSGSEDPSLWTGKDWQC